MHAYALFTKANNGWRPVKKFYDIAPIGFFVFTSNRWWPGGSILGIVEAHRAVMWAKRRGIEFKLMELSRGDVSGQWQSDRKDTP